ncbi:MAG: dihydrolipoyl dehydrogenase [bacterium]|nr:dihydrolipoyl dehydrogenase [bacterium]
MDIYDLIVIGAGPGGYVAAVHGARLGMNVALIEKEYVGGLCLNWGCIPSKILLKKGAVIEAARTMIEKGEIQGIIHPLFESIIAESRERVEAIREGLESLITSNAVHLLYGDATFTDNKTISVTLRDGNIKRLEAKEGIIIATGSRARILPSLIPVDREKIITSKEALMLTTLPKRLIIIGGGVTGCEMASFFRSLGSIVTILEQKEVLLPNIADEEIIKTLTRGFKERGIEVICNAAIVRCGAEGNETIVATHEKELRADYVLSAVGITPNTDHLGLEHTDVALQNGFIPVHPNTYETNVSGIYAIGDIIALPDRIHPPMAHVASAEGEIAAEYIARKKSSWIINYDCVPSVIFTNPEIGSVGLSESRAKELYKEAIDVQRVRDSWMGIGIALKQTGLTKIIREQRHKSIVGAHIIGAYATERIHACAVAMRAEETTPTMSKQIMAHPTYSESIREALLAFDGKAVHVPFMHQKRAQ